MNCPRGAVMLDVIGTELSAADIKRLMHPLVGAVILFSRNYTSHHQLAKLTKEIHRLRNPKLLIAVDHEGGRVQRFREGFTPVPPAGLYGQLIHTDPQKAAQTAFDSGYVMACEMRELGIDFSFAPVLDLNIANNTVIGDRAFHSDPDVVTQLAKKYINGMRAAGMSATGKHYPGHGAVDADSHHELPIDQRTVEELWEQDLKPYQSLAKTDLSAIMTAHILYPQIDTHPPTFSSFWLKEILRQRIGFEGLIFSDDLNMQAAQIAGSPSQRADTALKAGCDMVILCNDPEGTDELLENLGPVDNSDLSNRQKFMELREDTTQQDSPDLLAAQTRLRESIS